MGTKEALSCIHVFTQNCRNVHKDVFLCFIDYEKAFDTIHHEKLIDVLNDLGIDGTVLQDNDVRINSISLHRAVRQGYILSLLALNGK